jgi:hypothetical protein
VIERSLRTTPKNSVATHPLRTGKRVSRRTPFRSCGLRSAHIRSKDQPRRKEPAIYKESGKSAFPNKGDRIGAVSAPQIVSPAVEARGKNDFLPEEIQFISRFKDGNHEIQSTHEAPMTRAKNHEDEVTILRGSHPSGRA